MTAAKASGRGWSAAAGRRSATRGGQEADRRRGGRERGGWIASNDRAAESRERAASRTDGNRAGGARRKRGLREAARMRIAGARRNGVRADGRAWCGDRNGKNSPIRCQAKNQWIAVRKIPTEVPTIRCAVLALLHCQPQRRRSSTLACVKRSNSPKQLPLRAIVSARALSQEKRSADATTIRAPSGSTKLGMSPLQVIDRGSRMQRGMRSPLRGTSILHSTVDAHLHSLASIVTRSARRGRCAPTVRIFSSTRASSPSLSVRRAASSCPCTLHTGTIGAAVKYPP